MKKKVLCVFSLILYLLVSCTFLSGRIEEEMLTLVQMQKCTSSKKTGLSMVLDARAIFIDNQGNHLYEVRDGIGWESGLRTYEVFSYNLELSRGIVSLYGVRNYNFVKSASRLPQEGELAVVVEEFETVDDQYLYYYYDGIPNVRDFPENSEVAAQGDNAFLLNMKDVSLPFFPHTAKTWTIITDMSDRIFSMTEVELFLKELPSVMLVFVILVMGIILWGCACIVSIRAEENKGLLFLNVTGIIAVLCLLWNTLKGIDLPASLLPSRNILDWEYYAEEFRIIFNAIAPTNETIQNLRLLAEQVKEQSFRILVSAILLALGVIVFEIAVSHRNRHRRKSENL